MAKAVHQMGMSKQEAGFLEWMVKACPTFKIKGKKYFNQEDILNFISNFAKAVESKDASFLTQQRGRWVKRVVDVIEFAESKEFFAQKGYIRPAIKEELWRLFHEPEQDYVEAVLCLTGDTVVPLLDGSMPTLKELSETIPEGEEFWLYSYLQGEMVPAQGRLPHKTGVDEIWRVTFTDGTHVKGNARHQFINTDGEKVQIQNLQSGDRLASFYANREKTNKQGSYYLREVHRQKGGKGEFVHKTVMRHLTGESRIKGYDIHHEDFNSLNNSPANMDWYWIPDHKKMHMCQSLKAIGDYNARPLEERSVIAARNARKCLRWNDPNQRVEASKRMIKLNNSGHASFYANQYWNSEEGTQEKIARADRMHKVNETHPNKRDDITTDDLFETAAQCRVFKDLPAALGCSVTKVYSLLKQVGLTFKEFRDTHMPLSPKQKHKGRNHVVAKVECLGYEEDVYCLTVDGPGVFMIQTFGESEYVINSVCSRNTGAIGIGKNFFTDMAMGYMLYTLSTYFNPQIEFDLAPGSSIIFIQQSLSERLAKKVVFTQFCARLKLSPYFAKHFPFDPKVKSELRFPKNIEVLPVGGADTAAIGMNVFGGAIDEMNFMATTTDSKKAAHRRDSDYDQAEQVYMQLIRRMKSRFQQKGKLPGKLLLVSSVNHTEDFTARKIEEAASEVRKNGKTNIFIMKMSQWEALPADRFCGEKFLVEVGNEAKRSRVIDTREEAIDLEDVIEVPTEYKTDFERNIEDALRDFAGIAAGIKSPFIPYREEIQWAQEEHEKLFEGQSLFTVEECVIDLITGGDPDHPVWDQLVNIDYINDHIMDPAIEFASHVDVGVTGDAAGFGIGHISGYKLLPPSRYYDHKRNDFVEIRDARVPIYTVDGLLRLNAPPNGEIDLELVRDLVLYLRGIMNLKFATADSFQSTMMLQSWRKSRIKSGILSVDTSVDPYAEVKNSIKDKRILLPRHATASKELREIVHNGKKIEHPPGGTKDVSDALAGITHTMKTRLASFGKPVRAVRRGKAGGGRLSLNRGSGRKLRIRGGR
jgi:hypothetical protein